VWVGHAKVEGWVDAGGEVDAGGDGEGGGGVVIWQVFFLGEARGMAEAGRATTDLQAAKRVPCGCFSVREELTSGIDVVS
jgi:hypothetical protein